MSGGAPSNGHAKGLSAEGSVERAVPCVHDQKDASVGCGALAVGGCEAALAGAEALEVVPLPWAVAFVFAAVWS